MARIDCGTAKSWNEYDPKQARRIPSLTHHLCILERRENVEGVYRYLICPSGSYYSFKAGTCVHAVVQAHVSKTPATTASSYSSYRACLVWSSTCYVQAPAAVVVTASRVRHPLQETLHAGTLVISILPPSCLCTGQTSLKRTISTSLRRWSRSFDFRSIIVIRLEPG